MRRLAALCVALALVGCATTPAGQVDQGKAVAGLWASLQAASATADAAVTMGTLSGPDATRVADDLEKAKVLIQAADRAYALNQSDQVSIKSIAATMLIQEVVCVIKPMPGCRRTP